MRGGMHCTHAGKQGVQYGARAARQNTDEKTRKLGESTRGGGVGTHLGSRGRRKWRDEAKIFLVKARLSPVCSASTRNTLVDIYYSERWRRGGDGDGDDSRVCSTMRGV